MAIEGKKNKRKKEVINIKLIMLKGVFSFGPILLLAPIILFLAVVIMKIYDRNLETWTPDASEWSHAANFTNREMPVTYYEPGELNRILKSWDHSPFRVFRLKEGRE